MINTDFFSKMQRDLEVQAKKLKREADQARKAVEWMQRDLEQTRAVAFAKLQQERFDLLDGLPQRIDREAREKLNISEALRKAQASLEGEIKHMRLGGLPDKSSELTRLRATQAMGEAQRENEGMTRHFASVAVAAQSAMEKIRDVVGYTESSQHPALMDVNEKLRKLAHSDHIRKELEHPRSVKAEIESVLASKARVWDSQRSYVIESAKICAEESAQYEKLARAIAGTGNPLSRHFDSIDKWGASLSADTALLRHMSTTERALSEFTRHTNKQASIIDRALTDFTRGAERQTSTTRQALAKFAREATLLDTQLDRIRPDVLSLDLTAIREVSRWSEKSLKILREARPANIPPPLPPAPPPLSEEDAGKMLSAARRGAERVLGKSDHSAPLVDDIAQDAAEAVYSKARKQVVSNPAGLAFKTARSKARNHLKKEQRRQARFPLVAQHLIITEESRCNPNMDLVIDLGLLGLNPEERMVIDLHLQGQSIQHIMTVLRDHNGSAWHHAKVKDLIVKLGEVLRGDRTDERWQQGWRN